MSDDFFHKPPDLRSLPASLREQMKGMSPLRDGEVHTMLTLHNHQFKGTTFPSARLWVEPYTETRAPHRQGTLLSIYDPTGNRLLVTARMLEGQSLITLGTLIQTYLQQGGDMERLRNVIKATVPDPSDS